MSRDHGEGRAFPDEFDDEFPVGPEPGNNAYCGRNVLRGLIDGIEDFIHLRQPRWEQFRPIGPILLGSSMWIDDGELIGKLGKRSGACILVTKQDRAPKKLRELERLHEINDRTPGLPIRAFSSLCGLAPKVDGKPAVVGPYHPMDEAEVATIRTLGFRRRREMVPILHAKLALLGHLWWHDEGLDGRLEDFVGFKPRRLWVSSANLTRRSRCSLEFGYWTEDRALLEGAERFLVRLMAASEGLDPDADSFEPDLAPVEFDDDAMVEALSEMHRDGLDETG